MGGEVRQEEQRRWVEEPLTGFPVRLHGSAIHSDEVRACGGRPASTPTSMPTPAVLNPDHRRRCRQSTARPAATPKSGEWRQWTTSSPVHKFFFSSASRRRTMRQWGRDPSRTGTRPFFKHCSNGCATPQKMGRRTVSSPYQDLVWRPWYGVHGFDPESVTMATPLLLLFVFSFASRRLPSHQSLRRRLKSCWNTCRALQMRGRPVGVKSWKILICCMPD
jgi:hypothetical protein